jgi:biopolymer transport protein ExbD
MFELKEYQGYLSYLGLNTKKEDILDRIPKQSEKNLSKKTPNSFLKLKQNRNIYIFETQNVKLEQIRGLLGTIENQKENNEIYNLETNFDDLLQIIDKKFKEDKYNIGILPKFDYLDDILNFENKKINNYYGTEN